MSFIANNTVLSNFASIGRLDILKRIFRTLRISEEVWLEVKHGLEAGYSYQDKTLKATQGGDAWIKVVMVDDSERPDFVEFSQKLGYGESSSIAIARLFFICGIICRFFSVPPSFANLLLFSRA